MSKEPTEEEKVFFEKKYEEVMADIDAVQTHFGDDIKGFLIAVKNKYGIRIGFSLHKKEDKFIKYVQYNEMRDFIQGQYPDVFQIQQPILSEV
jgi:hypothetical protein